MLDPQLARESVPDQRQRILASLEAPAVGMPVKDTPKAREASLERIRQVQAAMVDEPDFDKRTDLRNELRELSKRHREQFTDDNSRSHSPD